MTRGTQSPICERGWACTSASPCKKTDFRRRKEKTNTSGESHTVVPAGLGDELWLEFMIKRSCILTALELLKRSELQSPLQISVSVDLLCVPPVGYQEEDLSWHYLKGWVRCARSSSGLIYSISHRLLLNIIGWVFISLSYSAVIPFVSDTGLNSFVCSTNLLYIFFHLSKVYLSQSDRL